MRSLDVRSWFGSIGRMSHWVPTRRNRHAPLGVELMEVRALLSSISALSSAYRTFNPQQDPSTVVSPATPAGPVAIPVLQAIRVRGVEDPNQGI
jgi:hypothetical protein